MFDIVYPPASRATMEWAAERWDAFAASVEALALPGPSGRTAKERATFYREIAAKLRQEAAQVPA